MHQSFPTLTVSILVFEQLSTDKPSVVILHTPEF